MDKRGKSVDIKVYISWIGALLYLKTCKLNIMFSVCICARFQVNPKKSYLNVVKRIFRYLKGTLNIALRCPKGSSFQLKVFLDADFKGCEIDKKNTSDACQFLENLLVLWFSKKQNLVATYTMKVKYIFVASCCAQLS